MRPALWLPVACLTISLAITAPVATAKEAVSDDQIRQRIIHDSISAYSGNCPCPFNTMRNGRSCGGRSAYSRPGGKAPLCYPQDVSKAMVDQYRRSHGF